jgi:hypothetical protein
MPSLQNMLDAVKIIKAFTRPGEWVIITPEGRTHADKDLDKLVQISLKVHKEETQKFPDKDKTKR